MTETADIASALVERLGLSDPPVQVSYLDAPPQGVPQHPQGAPSVCTFFAEGQRSPFWVDLAGHEACEIGAFVLGIPPAGELGTRLMATVGKMQADGYLAVGEEARIPRNPTPPRYVAYGPLGTLPVPPTDVLLFATPRSAMLAMEAAPAPVPMNGRPMCAIVPTLNAGAPVAVSIGCVGSRVYTRMGDDRLIVGIRGDFLEEFVRRLATIQTANEHVAAEDRARRAGYSPAPTAAPRAPIRRRPSRSPRPRHARVGPSARGRAGRRGPRRSRGTLRGTRRTRPG